MKIPIACTLGPDERTDRRAQWERVGADAVARRAVDDGFDVEFRATEAVLRSLPALVDAESQCCGFATWRLVRGDATVTLEVRGPSEGVAALRGLFGVD